nr:uncharacterized protein LOC112026083 [Quercus suber]
MACLNGIQKAIAFHPLHSLLELEKVLHKDLNTLLDQEEELWVQKSRINRLIEGDCNTTFHHMSTIVRRRRNKISCIKNDMEIKDDLWALKAFKALGLDGLHAGFFQKFWLIVGDSVKAEVRKAFMDCKIPEYLNQTNVVLIPKMAGRRSVDNAIVVQEIIHTISSKKGRLGYMAIKVDLEKAYDKIELSFIREVLINANLPQNVISLIMSCVSLVSTSILFNGGNMEPILPSRGIWQGDPFLPYLFILCMEALGYFIKEKCKNKGWIPIKSSNNGVAFSHLFFANDLVLFVKVDHVNCSTIWDVLDDFCARSKQSISESKSRVFFSPNVDVATRESLCDILGFRSTPNLGKYPGFPIKYRRTTNEDLNFVLERVKQKLAGWKANLLSLAGRVVLIQASTSTIPTYIMQCTALPKKLLDNIDRVNRNFLWGSTDDAKKVHRVGWHKVTKPKEEGGLGIQAAKGRNQALLVKLNWRFRMEKDALWVRVLNVNIALIED